ncbi:MULTISPECIES: OmpP1/FadL family transporter [Vibrio]|uniref:OmpP1/FadL family transporter n=1 Tax=Vibrio TaxID=662 RepID=UPI001CF3CD0C|nr:outer membrane protein transport protein [Vibrio alginolyticus]MDW2258498.1 outer membrane protein transport protein [Vibrio sp. 1409]
MLLNEVSKNLAVVLILCGFSSQVFAGGYMFSELGELSTSTAGAGSAAVAEGAEAAFVNPASMVRLKGKHIATNLGLLNLDSTYYDMGSNVGGHESSFKETSLKKLLPIGSFYFTNEIDDKSSFGIAMGATGGAGFGYGSGFSGSIMAQDGLLLTAQLNPSVAYKVNDKLSLGIGVSAEMAYINQTLNTTAIDGGLNVIDGEISADDISFGWNIGVMYQFSDANRIGFAYRSQIEHELEGDLALKVEGRYIGLPSGKSSLPAQVNVIMPAQVKLSGYHVVKNNVALLWTLGWQDLSAVQQTDVIVHGSNSPIIRSWKDTYSTAIGGHFKINKSLRFELGYSYETSPQDDPTKINVDVPTGPISKYSTGLTWFINEAMKAQFYYEHLDGNSVRTQAPDNLTNGDLTQLNGVYDLNVHFVGAVLNYAF